jgi:hypothetical protein
MWPQSVECTKCGESARVRAYGHIDYERQPELSREPSRVQLTIDCPRCGVRAQYFSLSSNLVDKELGRR